MARFFIKTYGCQMNVSDSSDCRDKLLTLGLTPASDESQADLVLVNSCVVRAKAENKVVSHLGRLNLLRQEGSNLQVVLLGCITEAMKRRVRSLYPFVIDILPGNDTSSYADSLESITQSLSLVEDGFEPGSFEHRSTPAHRFLPVARGCANRCSYCIVPQVRGELRSRERGEIVDELRRTFESGVKAVTLLGQNVLAYGVDLSPRTDFVTLLKDIGECGYDDRWVFFLTSHPRDFDEVLLRAVSDYPVFSRFLHLPLQAGSDEVLKRMRRGYTSGKFKEKVALAREILPDAVLSTDLLVGFPGETEEQFQETVNAARDIRFDSAFTFFYTDREGTEASGWENGLTHDAKLDRLNRLIDVQNPITLDSNEGMVGREVRLLIDEPTRSPGSGMKGFTRENRTIIVEDTDAEPGSFVQVEVTRATMRSLKGKIVG